MAIVEKVQDPFRSMKGVHLYHSAPSNCSQRVRVSLEEKGVNWTSHLIDLSANEHLTPQYQCLHPDGVVPALVHDGTVVIESNDIIHYIDECFDGPSLAHETDSGREQVEALLGVSSEVQLAIKLLSYTYLYAHRIRKSPTEMEAYARAQQNKSLVAWQRRFNNDDFSKQEFEDARQQLISALNLLEDTLAQGSWLGGETFGLADISWMVNVHRAALLDLRQPDLLGLQSFANVCAWLKRVRSRPSYDKSLTAYEPKWSE
jgi:glutathione S-transferase